MLIKNALHNTKDICTRVACALLCALLAVPMLSVPEGALAASEGVTNAKVVLRKEANKDSKALQTLYAGEEVDILNTTGDWYKVRYGKYTGYVMKKYVKTSASSTSSSNTSSSGSSVSSKIKALGSAPGIMRVGDENSDVKKLQQALEILGYYDGKIDGKYGSGTTAAVKAYQKAKGLTPDGYAGERTVKSIFGTFNSKSLTTQAAPGGGSSSSSVSTARYPTVDSIAQIGSAPATSRMGDSGTKVVKLQQALECLGYYDGAIDGSY
ncbi:MAG: peptidoglycan-binding protein, partial [Clostridia bacterium]|nr:peptidoglycan-binding protein [Clostridia bacterium]